MDIAHSEKNKPRAPRPGKDIDVDVDVDANGMVKSQADELLPQGASTTLDPNKSPLSGHYHTIPEGSKLPDSLGIKVDGKDVIPGSLHAAGHATIYPTRDMPMTEFQNLFYSIHWQYCGKI